MLADHVSFEVEFIDRMYLNVWVLRLAYGGGAAGFFVGHRGHAYDAAVAAGGASHSARTALLCRSASIRSNSGLGAFRVADTSLSTYTPTTRAPIRSAIARQSASCRCTPDRCSSGSREILA
ncbi:MAG TPA: hypothetical protein VK908_03210 [Jiangellales bacterium]|nr:hypothetical protein [Jiangellales bacterium]